MALSYALISRGNTPLCQYCNESGNFDLYYQKFLSNHDTVDGKVIIYQYDNMSWGILRDSNSLTVLCVVHSECDNDSIERVLLEIKSRFLRLNGSTWQKAPTFSLQSSFQPQLAEIVSRFQIIASSSEPRPPSSFSIPNDNTPLIAQYDSGSNDVSSSTKYKPKHWIHIIILIIIALCLIYLIFVIACHGITLPKCI